VHESAVVNLKFQRGEVLQGLEWPRASVLAAMPIKTKVSSHYPQPSGEASTAFRLEPQQSLKTISSKSLANVEITIRGRILVRCASAGGLVQDRAIRL
jgi:hypothetical protein